MEPNKNYTIDGRLSPKVRQFLRGVNRGRPFNKIGAVKARVAFAKLQDQGRTALDGIEISELGGGIKVIRPSGSGNKRLRTYFHIHGGGWVLQGWDVNARFVRDIVVASGCACVFIDYPLSPENKFPTALSQMTTIIKSFLDGEYKRPDLDFSKAIILGNSVGGNMAWVLSQYFLKGRISKLILCWPFMSKKHTESWKEFATDRYLTTDAMDWFCKEYLPAGQIAGIGAVYPLEAEDFRLKSTPPTTIHCGHNDILRDCGEEFGMRLMNNGVDVVVLEYQGVIHDWGVLNGLADIPQTRALIRNIAVDLNE